MHAWYGAVWRCVVWCVSGVRRVVCKRCLWCGVVQCGVVARCGPRSAEAGQGEEPRRQAAPLRTYCTGFHTPAFLCLPNQCSQYIHIRDRNRFPDVKAVVQHYLPAQPRRREVTPDDGREHDVGALFLVPGFFGDSGNVRFEDEPVTTRYTLRGTNASVVAKVVFLCEWLEGYLTPHVVKFLKPEGSDFATIFPDGCVGT